MDSFEWNKIFGAVLLAALVGMMAGFIADRSVHAEKLEKPVLAIDGAAADAAPTAVAEAPVGPADISELLKTASVDDGMKVAKACAACHSFGKGEAAKVGPNLYGVVGGPHAHMEGFAYSEALKGMHDKVWSEDELNHFLYNPKAYAKGTKMAFAGIKKDADRAAVIAYLRSLK